MVRNCISGSGYWVHQQRQHYEDGPLPAHVYLAQFLCTGVAKAVGAFRPMRYALASSTMVRAPRPSGNWYCSTMRTRHLACLACSAASMISPEASGPL